MPDNFERAKDDILSRTAANGGPKPIDLLTAMGALALDVDDAMGGLSEKFDKHCVDSQTRLDDMEAWRGTLCEDLERHHEDICRKHVSEMHDDHVAEMQKLGLMDDEGEEQARRVWFMWLLGSKAVYIIVAVCIFILQMLSNWVWHEYLMREP